MSSKVYLIDAMPQDSTSSPFLASLFALPQNQSYVSNNADVSLPKISLPKFSGDYTDWAPFHDIYIYLVHQNKTISNIQKFYYLKGTLLGEAAALVKAKSVTEANYGTVWSTLENMYHHKPIIVDTLLKKIFSVPESNGTSKGSQIHKRYFKTF